MEIVGEKVLEKARESVGKTFNDPTSWI